MIPVRSALPLIVLALAACATGSVEVGTGADTRAARRLLTEAAAAGPVRLEDNLGSVNRALSRAELETAAARGVPNLTLRFAAPPAAGGTARLLFLFDPPHETVPEHACGAPMLPAPAPEGSSARLAAVFCDGGAYIAHTAASSPGRDPNARRRLVWRVTARLFPDDYADSYGLDLFGNRIGIGGSFGF